MSKNDFYRLHKIQMKTNILHWLIALLLVMLILSGCNQRNVLHIGDKPQRIELTDIHGNKMTLPDDLKGRVAMVRFWSVDCPDCNKQIFKSMEELNLKYKDKGFITVSVNVKHPPESIEEFRRIENLITYPVLLDPDAQTPGLYGLTVMPVTFILDRNGVVKQKVIGEAGIEVFEAFLPPLL